MEVQRVRDMNPSHLKLVVVWITTGSNSLVLIMGHYGSARNSLHVEVVQFGLVLFGEQIGLVWSWTSTHCFISFYLAKQIEFCERLAANTLKH